MTTISRSRTDDRVIIDGNEAAASVAFRLNELLSLIHI